MQDFSQFGPMNFSMWANPDNSIAYQQKKPLPGQTDPRLPGLGDTPGVADPIPTAGPAVAPLQAHAAPLPDSPQAHSLWNPESETPKYQHTPWVQSLLSFPEQQQAEEKKGGLLSSIASLFG